MSDTGFPNDPFPDEAPSPSAPPTEAPVPAPVPVPTPSPVAPPPPPAVPPPAAPVYPGFAPPPATAYASAYPSPAVLPPPRPAVAYAGFWIRFVAWFIDALILYVIALGTNTVMRAAAGIPVMPIWKASRGATFGSGCAEICVSIIVGWLYKALSESSAAQATPGKRAMRLRVTDMEGRRISFARATGRTFAKILSALTLGVGYMMAGFTSRHQALHDLIAETVVLHDLR
jgi:uncharacterized RDD family membrane protein YckC